MNIVVRLLEHVLNDGLGDEHHGCANQNDHQQLQLNSLLVLRALQQGVRFLWDLSAAEEHADHRCDN